MRHAGLRKWVLLFVLCLALGGLCLIPGIAGAAGSSSSSASAKVVKELTDLRTEYSKTFLLSNGARQAVVYSGPIQVKDEKGNWKEIDTSLVPSADGSYVSAATPMKVKLAKKAKAAPVVSLSYRGASLELTMNDYVFAAPTVTGSTASYVATGLTEQGMTPSTPVAAGTTTSDTLSETTTSISDALPEATTTETTEAAPESTTTSEAPADSEVSLSYQVLGSGLKETISLAGPGAPGTFTFTIRHPGLTLYEDSMGTWGFYQMLEEGPVMILGGLAVFDSSKNEVEEPAYCDGAAMTVTPGPGESTITYTVPAAWLSDPARVFPVSIDPTIYPASAAADTCTSDSYPTTSYGTQVDLNVGYRGSVTGHQRAYLKFTLPSDLTGAYVQTAFLQLHESAQYLNSPQVCRVAMMSKDWTESSTYNSIGAPSTYELLHAKECPTTGSSPQDLSFSFPEAAQAYADGSTNFGFCIYSDATDTNDYRKIDSRECPTQEYRPTLEITYLPAIRMQTSNPTGDYYVDGDGAQDDTDAIQAAIDDTDAGVVVLPAGTFKTTGLHIGRSDFVLRGAGTSTQLTVASSDQDHVLLIGAASSAISDVTVKDLYVRMPASGDGIRLEGNGGGSHITLTALSLGGGADSSTTHAISVGSGFDDLTILGNDLTGVTALPFGVSSSVSRAGICTNSLAYDPYVPEFFGGEDRYDTSVRITSLSYPGGVPGGTVVLAPGDDNAYTSALCAVPLARAYSGPLLLTPSAGLDDAVKTELQHQNPDLIFLVGLSDALVTAVQHAMPSSTVTKLTGVDVNDTAAKVAGQIKTKVGTVTQVVIVPGDDFHDAITVGAVAANNKWPILYTPKAGPLPQTTQTCYHTTLGATKALVVGVNTSVSVPYITSPVRVNGADGPDTAGLVADYAAGLSSNPSTYLYTGLATGEDWPDAVLVGKYMGQWAGTVLLTNGSTIPSATQSRLNLHVYDLLGLKYINLPAPYAADQNPGLFVPGAPRHTPYDLGDFAGHAAQATLDTGRLEVTTTDLEIASFGPRAALDRTYWSTRTAAGYIAPGWRFSFERSLNVSLAASGRIDYLDEVGETFTFIKHSARWLSPPGMAGTLRPDGSNWKLTPPGGNTLAFDSSGKLISEADDNGNTVTYTWTSGYLTRITAANAQQIQLNLNGSHQLTQAVYQTTNGTRTATYTTASPWTVTYSFSGSPSTPSRSLTYGFTSSLLSAITASAFTGSTNATESFTYSGSPSKLSTVCFADYDASANPDARAEIAYAGTSATITTYGRVYATSAVSGADHTAVAQTFTWNSSGTLASKTNPKTASEATQTWSYTYSPLGNYLLTETSPLNKTRTWTYNNRGNMTSEQDELGHTTTYTYPDLDPDFGGYVTSQVSANADDAYDANTTLHATDYFYEAVGRGTAVDKAGFRFQNVSVPTGATITSAQLHLYAYYSATGNPALLNTKLGLEDQDNPGAWVTGTHEPRSATMTSAYVTWAPSSWAAGTWYDSPNLKDSVQEVVDRAGWASGHAMAVLWVDNGTAASNLCNPADSSSGASAVLTIYWTRNLDPDPTEDQPKTVTDPRGHTTEYSYDAQGNLTKVVRQLSATESAETDYTYADKTVGSATYHGALVQQKSLVSGTPASGVWATTDFAPPTPHPTTSTTRTAGRKRSSTGEWLWGMGRVPTLPLLRPTTTSATCFPRPMRPGRPPRPIPTTSPATCLPPPARPSRPPSGRPPAPRSWGTTLTIPGDTRPNPGQPPRARPPRPRRAGQRPPTTRSGG